MKGTRLTVTDFFDESDTSCPRFRVCCLTRCMLLMHIIYPALYLSLLAVSLCYCQFVVLNVISYCNQCAKHGYSLVQSYSDIFRVCRLKLCEHSL